MNSPFDPHAMEIRALFFQTAPDLLQALNEQGLALEKDPANPHALAEIRRLVHTLKGDSAACGLPQLSQLAHELEDVLTPEIAAAHTAALPEIVLSAADMFDALCAAYRANLDPPSADPLRSLIGKLSNPAAVPVSSPPPCSWTEYDQLAIANAVAGGRRVYQIAAAIPPALPLRTAAIELLYKVLREGATVLAVAPAEPLWEQAEYVQFAVAADHDPDWLANQCRIPGVVQQLSIQTLLPPLPAPTTDAVAPQAVSAHPPLAAPLAPLANASPAAILGPRTDSTLRVDAQRIDHLLNLVGELVIAKSMLHQTLQQFAQRFPKDPLRTQFADAMAFQAQVLHALQRSAMKIRMVPVEQLFRRFPRLVRDLARRCGKDVALCLSGQDTDLDKTLLDAIAEPISHLLRNAVDHGIELPAQRRASGKPQQATIRLHAGHHGNQLVIEISDDGRGIDTAAVLAKAVSRGRINPEQASRMPASQAMDLIFEPGFSTAEHVSEISGRGIGMDVVKAATDKLKGGITVETQPGRGTTFRLRLPLTLAIIRALLFRVSDRLYALPLESVIEITRAPEAEIHHLDRHEVLHLRHQVLPLLRLHRLAPAAFDPRDRCPFVIVVGDGQRKFGLVVDKLVGEEELVIKPLDKAFLAMDLVNGASLRGDGTVVLILNVTEVVRNFANTHPASAAEPAATSAGHEAGPLAHSAEARA